MARELPRYSDPAVFASFLSPEPNSGCWLWMGAYDRDGYGVFHPYGRAGGQWRAHRFAYLLFRGEIPGDLCVLHRCDVRACANPEHLFLGTNVENTQDKIAKGRQIRGEQMPHSKLTEAKVKQVRRLFDQGRPARDLAARFNVDTTCIYAIVRRKTWTHVH